MRSPASIEYRRKRPAFADRKIRPISFAMYDDQGHVIGG
jgi:hypothetical protein